MVRRLRILPALAVALATAAAPASAHAAGHREAHVVHPPGGTPYIADGHGRQLLLRGVAANALIDYAADYQEEVPLTRADFREMAALGFTVLRLPVSWSRIEPRPNVIDSAYLDEIARTVHAAERHGLRVWIDMHQDRYNRHADPGGEADGAPDWATDTDGLPCRPAVESTPCAQAAYQHFWDDDTVAGRPLWDHYLGALLAVSRRLRADRRLLGFELMNEPTPGFAAPPAFERLELWPFYRHLVAGLRADGETRMIFFDPNIFRDLTDADSGVAQRFSTDPDLVYAPHLYTETFSPPMQPTGIEAHLRASFLTAEEEARAYGAALVDGEWGGGSGGAWETKRAEELDLQDAYRVGSAFWIWKQRPGFYDWEVVREDGSLRPDSLRAQQLSRPRVEAAPGRIVSTGLSGDTLTTVVDGPAGVAAFWSGTVVRRGGPSPLAAPLTRACVDGRPARARLRRRGFATPRVALRGYRVAVRVPAGQHAIALEPPSAPCA